MASRWLSRHKVPATVLVILIAVGTMGMLERGVRDPYNRTVGPHRVLAVALVKAGITNVGICRCSSDREVTLHGPYGLTTKASIYGSAGPDRRPGILLIHGNTALGRELGTYKVMASELAERGYIVLSLDLPGFGESDNPFVTGNPRALDETKMIEEAIRHLITNTNVDKENLSIIGHSRGRAAALKVGVSAEPIKNIVLMGVSTHWVLDQPELPDRRTRETHEFVYGNPLPDWVTADIWRNHIVSADIGSYLPYFARDGHKPLMVIIGENERLKTTDMIMGRGPSELTDNTNDYLDQKFAAFTEPKRMVTLKRSDHYNNTAQWLGLIVYDRTVVAQLVDELTNWFELSLPPQT